MKIAKTAGFCFGVNRAVKFVYDLIEKGEKVVTLGPIIHNTPLLKELKKRGVKIIDTPEQANNDVTLVIRAHGIPEDVLQRIKIQKIRYIDATCPFVFKIHKIVTNISQNSIIFIAGDKNHPEVKGIIGHCRTRNYVFKNQSELKELLKNLNIDKNSQIFVISQTTFLLNEWNLCLKTIESHFTNVKISATICNATKERQLEAKEIAKISDIMFVIGDKHSSNTAKIRDICCNYCKTYLIETANDITKFKITTQMDIGVTAGASTPVNIIEEALNTMTKILNSKNEAPTEQEEQNFEQMLEESLKNLSTDEKVRGVVTGITPSEVYVDINRKHAGFIPINELSSKPILKPEEVVKIGDELDLLIMKTNDQEGTVMLSKKRLDAVKGFDAIVKACQNEEILKGIVVELVKGGAIVISNDVRVFIPASQATNNRSKPLENLLKTEVSFRVIEVNKAKRRIIGSIRSVLKDEQKLATDKFWETVQMGTIFSGTVKSLTNYGAFVSLGPVDGMIHVSELSWRKIKHPSDIVNLGDKVEVYIKDLDFDKRKISLGYKKSEDNPWEKFKEQYKIGDIAEAQIVGFTEYGAFAQIIPGVDGLIHISQISENRIDKPQSALKMNETVKTLIKDINLEKRRVSLSIKELAYPTTTETL
ncbi:MAG: bifunctional 4-hydroxy-3-methylbut-2-enyl diphosphate reductase/30S ribosomal protein S1 [Oscillospiraceae bacterium]|nr:bifunctional 4-hydroxy-3-methylbut-2-enyl diphosphate reductase/30S ribosomal protein S1 [Oscillospiraceae bacterium]